MWLARVDNLPLVLSEQLEPHATAQKQLAKSRDVVPMVETGREATFVRSNKYRIVLFRSAMRHFARDTERRPVKRVVFLTLVAGRGRGMAGRCLRS